MHNIDEEYDRFVEHLLDCTRKTESFKTTKKRLSLETLELIRQRGAAGLKKSWMMDSHASKQGFEKDSAQLTTFTLLRNSSRYHESTSATLENAMRGLEWDDMGVKIDGLLHHFHFTDYIVLITSSISQAEGMLTEFDETCRCMGLQLNLQKMLFMRY
ncbi:hypothetical protein RB195_025308 [Necator americanus]|uniref:Reverse transcriptase domain-containing protein n=1 Tax=Necator americanus TaxID=51031 RepID=A0ABR1ERR4_NECAM